MDGQSSTMRHLKVGIVFRLVIGKVLPMESLHLVIVFDCQFSIVVSCSPQLFISLLYRELG